MGENRRVIVVGAGISGLAAARELTQRGYEVTVLEGRDRPGGRTVSVDMGGSMVDLGAAFIHGVEGNPLSAIVKEMGLTPVPFEQCTLYQSDGWPADIREDRRVERIFNDVLERCHQAAVQHLEQRGRSFSDATAASREPAPGLSNTIGSGGSRRRPASTLKPSAGATAATAAAAGAASTPSGNGAAADGAVDSRNGVHSTVAAATGAAAGVEPAQPQRILPGRLDELLAQEGKSLLSGLSKGEQQLFNWHRGNLEIACGADLSELSAVHWNQDDRYQYEGDHVMLREGYGCLVKALSKRLDIRYQAEVKVIKLDTTAVKGVQATTADGRTFDADFLVCTLPLGVLKARAVRFDPVLPQAKTDSIRALGFGCLNKVVMLFPTVFWDTMDFIGHAADTRGQWVLFADLSRMTGQAVLVAMTGGPFATSIERLSDSGILQQIMAVLKRIYHKVPEPVKVEISRWKSDRFARGSFSFIAPDATAKDYDTLSEPLCDGFGVPRVLFAGEATTRYHPSTTTGAWLSGLREAMRIDMLVRPTKHKEPFDPDCVYDCSIRFPRVPHSERSPFTGAPSPCELKLTAT
ncbi:amine oxidase [Tribonema minus]|uniref:Amine oxidase n=1 Tax=Tribonema minus TaxID=303371 RepID=A0A835YJ29_9STRA|nr:amine oxidase [Tribonema minus]